MGMDPANGRRRYNVVSHWLRVSPYPEWSPRFLKHLKSLPLPFHIHRRKTIAAVYATTSIRTTRTWRPTWPLNILQLNQLSNATLVADVTCTTPDCVATLKQNTRLVQERYAHTVVRFLSINAAWPIMWRKHIRMSKWSTYQWPICGTINIIPFVGLK